MSDQNNDASTTAPSATTPLLPRADNSETSPRKTPQKSASASVTETQVVITSVSPAKAERPLSTVSQPKENNASAVVSPAPNPVTNEYRFVHQRIPNKTGKLKFLLPVLLLTFQVLFIVLFAVFGDYATEHKGAKDGHPLFEDLHAITLLGFGFLMTFLKRYGYGSIGFSLLLVAFVLQWALIVRGLVETNFSAHFSVGLRNLALADFTAIAVLVTFGALIGKTTLTQLVVVAVVEVVVQVFNEYINIELLKTYDVGRSVYVHLFGALFGLAASKFLHCGGVRSSKQAPVYHSDLFALIGTLFLFVYYPSFNSILSVTGGGNDLAHMRAVINTIAAISASCVVTFGVSSLAGKGKLSVLHVQHATIAGGIAIGAVADINVYIYVSLIVGSAAGLLATIGYQYIDPFLARVIKLHDTVSVQSLHVLPGLVSALLGAVFAFVSSETSQPDLLRIYPARGADLNRNAATQAGFQLIGLAVTAGVAIVFGGVTGLFLRLPVFEQLSQEVEMFDDEAQWVTPDDYALKLTFAAQPAAAEKKEDTKV